MTLGTEVVQNTSGEYAPSMAGPRIRPYPHGHHLVTGVHHERRRRVMEVFDQATFDPSQSG